MPLNLALIVFELVVMVLAISLHDCAQAWMAGRLGDPTGRMMGRVTMNPARRLSCLPPSWRCSCWSWCGIRFPG